MENGVTCFGSFVLKVNPDYASLTFESISIDKKTKNAFSKTKEKSRSLNKTLRSWKDIECRSSNLRLEEVREHVSGGWKKLGYKASIKTHVVVRDLNMVEDILTTAVEAGADSINSFSFGTSKLKEHRSEARRNSVKAAIEKAENYCIAAGVKLGKVVRIKDINPDRLTPYLESHVEDNTESELSENASAIDPGAISVNGAVEVTFEIRND